MIWVYLFLLQAEISVNILSGKKHSAYIAIHINISYSIH